MNSTSIFLFSIIFLILFGKWILFIFVIPYIKLTAFIHRRHLYQSSKSEQCSPEKFNEAQNNRNLFSKIKSSIRIFLDGFVRYMTFKVGMIPSHHIRNFIYIYIYILGVKMGKNAIVYFGAEIRGAYNLELGDGCIVGDKSVLDARRGGIKIGKNVQLGSFVKLWTGSHDHDDPYFRSMPHKRGPIKIGDRAWIGPCVTILHSVTIGEGAVVAAGSVVTKNVEPYSIVGGIPAKKIGERAHDLRYEFKGDYLRFY